MKQLAIHGGLPVRSKPFPAHLTIGLEEKQAVNRVMDSGVLSRFLGASHENFSGGDEVRALEKEWATYFGVKHAVSVNSCTSGLYCAVGAVGVEPGDEVIVSPYTMSASAVAPLVYNAIPVFADIEEDFYCLDPKSVEERITPRTRAILVVDIFGQPYDAGALNALARKHGLYVIEDCAQAPGARFGNSFAGTLGDIGVFSLNYHKHIHSGEGGVVVTNDDILAEKVRLIRNHAEAVLAGRRDVDLKNMVGFNYRMTELEAAIARCQLRKLKSLLDQRIANLEYLCNQLADIPALHRAKVRPDCYHAFYVHTFRYDADLAGISRETFVNAVKAELPVFEKRESEGVKLGSGYVRPLYLQPIFQKKVAYGSKGWPWTSPCYQGEMNYAKGLCPVTERMHESELITHEFMVPSMTRTDLDDVSVAFHKVWEQRSSLRNHL